MEFFSQWEKGFKKLLLSVKWTNIVQGKLWQCYFLFLTSWFSPSERFKHIAVPCSVPFPTVPAAGSPLAVRAFLQAMVRCEDEAWCSSPQQSCSFLVVAQRENIERVPCRIPAPLQPGALS